MERIDDNHLVRMEYLAPPLPPTLGPYDPRPASKQDVAELRALSAAPKSIAAAASLFKKKCEGGDDRKYQNNCAHFLSDAFLRAGYTELQPPSDCIEARCETGAKRPIRARNMWCWLKNMAKETRDVLPKNEGLWAVFQLNEKEYWGGHVIIFDSDRNVYYGTGHYPNWKQHCYKW